MRPKLIKSFFVVLTFWFVATTVYWSFQNPKVNHDALAAMTAMFPFLPIEPPVSASIYTSWRVQLEVLFYWTLPVLLLSLASGGIGYGVVWFFALRRNEARNERERGNGEYRGLTLTVGELPAPDVLPRDEIDIGADDNEALAQMTGLELRLLCDILGTISAHPDAFAGEGLSVPLMDHTLSLVSMALEHPRRPSLSALVASAGELGKITAYAAVDGEWILEKSVEKESARILGTLESWYALPQLERNAIMMAVKYKRAPQSIPDVEGDHQVHRLARELLNVAEGAQVQVETEEKQVTLSKTAELPEVLFDAFLRALPSLSFQSRGLPKGVAAIAWKVGTRVFMLEIKLRETVMAKLPAEIRGALTPSGKERLRLQPFTKELLKALQLQGWLVTEIDGMKVEESEALWNIKAGKLDFKGVIVIDVPDTYIKQLPTDDSMYPIAVSGPLFTGGGAVQKGGVSKEDLLASVLKPAGGE